MQENGPADRLENIIAETKGILRPGITTAMEDAVAEIARLRSVIVRYQAEKRAAEIGATFVG